MHPTELLSAEIGEVAMASEDVPGFRRALMATVDRRVGFDLAALQSSRAGSTCSVPGDDALDAELYRYVSEYSREEIERMSSSNTVSTDFVFTRARRERLAIFREWMAPRGFTRAATRVWPTQRGAMGTFWGRGGATRGFAAKELRLLDAVTPVLTVAEHFLLQRSTCLNGVQAFAFTARERQVVELVVKGFTNGEIGLLLGCSALTARNHLASIFRKAEVTTRTELVQVVTQARGDSGETTRCVPGTFVKTVHDTYPSQHVDRGGERSRGR